MIKLRSYLFIALMTHFILSLFTCKHVMALTGENEKIAVVTGASRGIGKVLVEELLNENIKVIAVVRQQKSLDALLQKYPQKLRVIEADLSTPEGQDSIAGYIPEPEIHYLVHGAALIEPLGTRSMLEAEPKALRKIFETNVMAPILLTNGLGSKLKKGSRVLNISSVAGDKAVQGLGAYCITKAALDRFSESLQLDKPHDILSTSVHPGRVDTGMQLELRDHVSDDFSAEKYKKYKTENKLISPETSAKYLKWLLVNSSDAHFLMKKHDIDSESKFWKEK